MRRTFICGRVICMETERSAVWGSRLLAATRILSARCHWHHYRHSHRFARVVRISNQNGRRSLIPRRIDYLQVHYSVLITDAFQLSTSSQSGQSYIKFLLNSILYKYFGRDLQLAERSMGQFKTRWSVFLFINWISLLLINFIIFIRTVIIQWLVHNSINFFYFLHHKIDHFSFWRVQLRINYMYKKIFYSTQMFPRQIVWNDSRREDMGLIILIPYFVHVPLADLARYCFSVHGAVSEIMGLRVWGACEVSPATSEVLCAPFLSNFRRLRRLPPWSRLRFPPFYFPSAFAADDRLSRLYRIRRSIFTS